ncbi:hypothetical protein BDR06DRAFT_997847 [Suillus hirtellus]|nr:hypothetical protein BDR06DRAFT_997847 [Suillus hirtellus]
MFIHLSTTFVVLLGLTALINAGVPAARHAAPLDKRSTVVTTRANYLALAREESPEPDPGKPVVTGRSIQEESPEPDPGKPIVTGREETPEPDPDKRVESPEPDPGKPVVTGREETPEPDPGKPVVTGRISLPLTQDITQSFSASAFDTLNRTADIWEPNDI